jgi:streptogramin lyase
MPTCMVIIGLLATSAALTASAGHAYAVDGYVQTAQWGTVGAGDGQFQNPTGIAVDPAGNVYVSDHPNHRVQKFTSDGQFLTKWGSAGAGDGQFSAPGNADVMGVAVGPTGDVYVADARNHRIQKFNSDGGFLAKWGGPSAGSGNGQFNFPQGVTADPTGDIYVSESGNNRIQKLTSTGAFITKWGGTQGTADGQFHDPSDVAADTAGNVYVADTGNARIQKFTSAGEFLMSWPKPGETPLYTPQGVATDLAGNVYVADYRTVRKYTSTGSLITEWKPYDDKLNGPKGVVVAENGTVYITNSLFWPNGSPVVAFRPAGPTPPPSGDPFTELPANDLAFHCDTRKIAIQFLERKGRTADVEGLAASSLIGQPVEIRIKRKGSDRPVDPDATTVVGSDGSFTGQLELPKSEAAVRRVQVVANVGTETSRNVKLTRRARISEASSTGGTTELRGKVLTKKAKSPPKLKVRRRVACKGKKKWQKVATGKQRRNGSFSVDFPNPPGTVGSIFDVKTHYTMQAGAKAEEPTATWAVALNLG